MSGVDNPARVHCILAKHRCIPVIPYCCNLAKVSVAILQRLKSRCKPLGFGLKNIHGDSFLSFGCCLAVHQSTARLPLEANVVAGQHALALGVGHALPCDERAWVSSSGAELSLRRLPEQQSQMV